MKSIVTSSQIKSTFTFYTKADNLTEPNLIAEDIWWSVTFKQFFLSMCTPHYRIEGFIIFLDSFLPPSVAQEDEYESSVCVCLYSLISIYIVYT